MDFLLAENCFHRVEQNLKFIKWYFYTLSSGIADDETFYIRNPGAPQESFVRQVQQSEWIPAPIP